MNQKLFRKIFKKKTLSICGYTFLYIENVRSTSTEVIAAYLKLIVSSDVYFSWDLELPFPLKMSAISPIMEKPLFLNITELNLLFTLTPPLKIGPRIFYFFFNRVS